MTNQELKSKCCEKCYISHPNRDDDYCSDNSCHCHSPQPAKCRHGKTVDCISCAIFPFPPTPQPADTSAPKEECDCPYIKEKSHERGIPGCHFDTPAPTPSEAEKKHSFPSPESPCFCDCHLHQEHKECNECLLGRHNLKSQTPSDQKDWELKGNWHEITTDCSEINCNDYLRGFISKVEAAAREDERKKWVLKYENSIGNTHQLLQEARTELLEKLRKEVKEIEKDGLTVGLEKQSRQIIDRVLVLLAQEKEDKN